MKTKICVFLLLVTFGVLFVKFSNNCINNISKKTNEYQTHLNIQNQSNRDYELEIFKALVDTILFRKNYIFTEKDITNFFTLDSICYVEKIGSDTLKVYGMDYYFIFSNGVLFKDSSDFYIIKSNEFNYYLNNKNIFIPYIPYCID